MVMMIMMFDYEICDPTKSPVMMIMMYVRMRVCIAAHT